MKKISVLTLVLLFVMASQSFAQLRYGVRAGLNLASMTIKTNGETEDTKTLTSFQVGGVVEYGIDDLFAVESGLYFTGKGVKVGDTSVNPLYLELPVNGLVRFNVTPDIKLHVLAGPYLGYGIAGKIKDGSESENIKYGSNDNSNMKALDFGLNFGGGAEYRNIVLRAQYGLGLIDLNPISVDKYSMKNGVFSISVAYMFGGK